MTIPAWDLDAPVETPLAIGGGGSLGPLLAICLAGLGVGGLVGSALSPTAAPSFPPIATLSVPNPSAVTTASESSSPGMARSTSVVRMSTASTAPPR
jgi:hypothetical protein